MAAILPRMQAQEIVRLLDLGRHPEGGWYRETWRAPAPDGAAQGQRPAGTAIYYLLGAGDRSRWHRVDAVEIWHWYGGAPLSLTLSPDGRDTAPLLLGPEIGAGQRPQQVVPPGCWQCAVSLGAWTLAGCTVSPGFEFAGCTVSPGFEFAGFELAPLDWRPGPRHEIEPPRGDGGA